MSPAASPAGRFDLLLPASALLAAAGPSLLLVGLLDRMTVLLGAALPAGPFLCAVSLLGLALGGLSVLRPRSRPGAIPLLVAGMVSAAASLAAPALLPSLDPVGGSLLLLLVSTIGCGQFLRMLLLRDQEDGEEGRGPTVLPAAALGSSLALLSGAWLLPVAGGGLLCGVGGIAQVLAAIFSLAVPTVGATPPGGIPAGDWGARWSLPRALAALGLGLLLAGITRSVLPQVAAPGVGPLLAWGSFLLGISLALFLARPAPSSRPLAIAAGLQLGLVLLLPWAGGWADWAFRSGPAGPAGRALGAALVLLPLAGIPGVLAGCVLDAFLRDRPGGSHGTRSAGTLLLLLGFFSAGVSLSVPLRVAVGAPRVLLATGAILAGAGLLSRSRGAAALLLCASLAAVLLPSPAAGPGAPWRPQGPPSPVREAIRTVRVLELPAGQWAETEGDGGSAVWLDGRPVARRVPEGLANTVLLGHLPFLFRGNPRSALVIADPDGREALAARGRLPQGTRIAPLVPLAGPPPRRVLQREAPGSLGILIVSAPDPAVPESSGLHTEEFYALASSRLDAKGLLATRVSLAGTGLAGLAAEIAALSVSFPEITAWSFDRAMTGEVVLLAGREPLTFPIPALATPTEANAAVSRPLAAYRADLRSVHLLGPWDVLEGYLGAAADLVPVTGEAAPWTDARPARHPADLLRPRERETLRTALYRPASLLLPVSEAATMLGGRWALSPGGLVTDLGGEWREEPGSWELRTRAETVSGVLNVSRRLRVRATLASGTRTLILDADPRPRLEPGDLLSRIEPFEDAATVRTGDAVVNRHPARWLLRQEQPGDQMIVLSWYCPATRHLYLVRSRDVGGASGYFEEALSFPLRHVRCDHPGPGQ